METLGSAAPIGSGRSANSRRREGTPRKRYHAHGPWAFMLSAPTIGPTSDGGAAGDDVARGHDIETRSRSSRPRGGRHQGGKATAAVTEAVAVPAASGGPRCAMKKPSGTRNARPLLQLPPSLSTIIRSGSTRASSSDRTIAKRLTKTFRPRAGPHTPASADEDVAGAVVAALGVGGAADKCKAPCAFPWSDPLASRTPTPRRRGPVPNKGAAEQTVLKGPVPPWPPFPRARAPPPPMR